MLLVLGLVKIQAHMLQLSKRQTFFLPSARESQVHYSQNQRLLFDFRESLVLLYAQRDIPFLPSQGEGFLLLHAGYCSIFL